jgi:hypothetical protein
MFIQRRVEKLSLGQKLVAQAIKLRLEAETANSSAERDQLLSKAMEAQTASEVQEWFNPTRLRTL